MANYKRVIDKKSLKRVKNPKSHVSYISNTIKEMQELKKKLDNFYMRMKHYIANIETNVADLVRELQGKEKGQKYFVLTTNPESDSFNEFYNVFLGPVPTNIKDSHFALQIKDLVDNGTELNDQLIEDIQDIYPKSASCPTGLQDSRDYKFVKEWLGTNKGKKVWFGIW